MALKFDDGLFQLVHSDEQNPKDDQNQFVMSAVNPKVGDGLFQMVHSDDKPPKMITINLLCRCER